MSATTYVISAEVSEDLEAQIRAKLPTNESASQVVIVESGDGANLVAIESIGFNVPGFRRELARTNVPAKKAKDGKWGVTFLRSGWGIATTVAVSAVATFGAVKGLRRFLAR